MTPEYFEIPELPGKRMFNCDRRRAMLQVERCSAMWEAAQVKDASERYLLCRGCQLGAKHAGVTEATLSPLFASTICGRCHGTGARLICSHLCVSCYNRELEYVKGRTRRGRAPQNHPTLHRVSVRYAAGGKVKVRTMGRATGTSELVVAVLRDEPKQATFCAMIHRPKQATQGDLFA